MAKSKVKELAPRQDDAEQMIAHDVTRLQTFWVLRDLQLQQDRDIINLIKTEKQTTDMKLWMTSEPKIFFDTARAMVSLYPPRFKLPIPINFEPEQKTKMNKAERLCIGIMRALNNRCADNGGANWLFEFAYWVLGGWYAVFNIVQKGEDGPEFLADIWDPINVYPEWDNNGLSRCVRAYTVDQFTAEGMAADFQDRGLDFKYQGPVEGELYTVTNYWRREKRKIYNAILLNGHTVKPLTLQRNLNRIPIQIGAVGIPDKVSPNWQIRRGESIIASARNEYEFKTALRSLRAEIVAETAFPNIISKSRTGQPVVKSEDVKGHGSVVPLKLEETIELLRHAASPQDVSILDAEVQQQINKANLPTVVYGGVPIELSGFAISQLMAAIKYKLGPYLNVMEYAIGRILTDLLYQYRTGSFGKVTLSAPDPYSMRRGMTYIEEFSKDDVPERIYVEASIPISSQFDKTQSILNSVQALQSGLMSRETLWENDLDVQDSEQEKQRIIEDKVSSDPFILQLEIIMRMRERVSVYKAAGMEAEAQALTEYITMLETQAKINRNTGTPQALPGISPEQRPVEMTPQSPDIANAAKGRGPPSPNRTTKKTGILFTPDGRQLM